MGFNVIVGSWTRQAHSLDADDLACNQIAHVLTDAVGILPARSGIPSFSSEKSVPVKGSLLDQRCECDAQHCEGWIMDQAET